MQLGHADIRKFLNSATVCPNDIIIRNSHASIFYSGSNAGKAMLLEPIKHSKFGNKIEKATQKGTY